MRLFVALCLSSFLQSVALAQLTVVATDPPMHALHRAPNTSIVIDFDRALSAASLGNVHVYGRSSGGIAGSTSLENGDARLRFRPSRPLIAGETVDVLLAEGLQAQDGSFLRTEGYAFSFRVRTEAAPRVFTEIASWDVDPNQFARPYGGQTADLDRDGFGDLAIICENSSDVRVYLNGDDATGSFGPLFGGANAVGSTPSPNENADLDGDGLIDIVTCESGSNSVSVLLGNGDGTFQASTVYGVGGPSHGMALLDVDGDGDVDIAATANDAVRLRRNDGLGSFGALETIATSIQSDYGLAAADMDNDAIVDLVVGSTSGEAMVLLSNGDGTFVEQTPRACGGFAWMIGLADVNGDGNVDVSVATGGNGRGAMLRGNGDGTLQAPFVTPSVGHMVATDLGDLDGDGDIDWALSSFGGGLYQIWRNDGAGNFALDQTLPALSNPSCCAMLDIDGDRDLDLALFDEIADIVTILENGSLDQQTFCYGTAAACPCGNAGASGHGCDHASSTGGALLLAQGVASVANDALTLNVGGMPTSTQAIFLQGVSQAGGGLGVAFGDGLLCVGAPFKRLGTKAANNGYQSFGAAVLGDPLISVKGQIPPGGGTFHYQAWYRNNPSFCTAATSNLSNGVSVLWTP